MPEWLYLLGWLAVPVAAVLGSLWWHERECHQVADELIRMLQDGNRDLLEMNHRLRLALNSAERENRDLRAQERVQ